MRHLIVIFVSVFFLILISFLLNRLLFKNTIDFDLAFKFSPVSIDSIGSISEENFNSSNSNILTLGYRQETVIVRLSNIKYENSNRLNLNVLYPHLDYILIQYKSKNGEIINLKGGRKEINFSGINNFSFEIENPDITNNLYMAVSTKSSYVIPIILLDSNFQNLNETSVYLSEVSILLFIAFMFLFNISFFGIFKDKIFIIYSLYILSFFVYTLYGSNYTLQELGLFDYNKNIFLIKASIISLGILTLYFLLNFFELKKGDIFFYITLILISAWAILFASIPFLSYDKFMIGITYLAVFSSLFIIIISLKKIKERFKPATIYFSSWIILFLTVIYHSYFIMGFSYSTTLFLNVLKVSFCIQIFLVTSSVAYKIFFLIKENEILLIECDSFKNELLANTSHDLKTPLLGLMGLLEYSLEKYSDGINLTLKNNLLKILACSRKLNILVDDILDYSRASNGKLKIFKEEVNSYLLVESVIEILKFSGFQNNIKIINNIDPNDSMVYCDENRLIQVFYNLIGNSLKFTIDGYIQVSKTKSNNLDQFIIEDTGIGITEKNSESLLYEYFQMDYNDNEKKIRYGLGLGLSIVKNIIEEHSGNIKISSTEGKGTKISISFPVKNNSNFRPSNNEEYKNNKINSLFNKKGSKILLVDDDDVNLIYLKNILNDEGYYVKTLCEATKVIPLIKNTKFDLIIIDVMMPVISGYDLCREIRLIYETIELPIALITSRNNNADFTLAFSSGANDYLPRSIKKIELLQRIKNLLEIKNAYKKVNYLNEKLDKAVSLSNIDSLTGIYNRRFFFEEVQKKFDSFIDSQMEISLLMIDVDHFKSINDTYGHGVGDRILVKIAELLHFSIREEDLICRYGGEEFLILLVNKDKDSSIIIAERLRKTIANQLYLDKMENPIEISISIGISFANERVKTIEDLLEIADKNLYKAKNSGRNCVNFSTELTV